MSGLQIYKNSQTGRLISSNGASSFATPRTLLEDVKKRNTVTLSALFYLAFKLADQLNSINNERIFRYDHQKNAPSLSLNSKYFSLIVRQDNFLYLKLRFYDLYKYFPENEHLLSKSDKEQISKSVSCNICYLDNNKNKLLKPPVKTCEFF